MRFGLLRLMAVTLAMAAATNQSQANFVVNGGFETGSFSPWVQAGNVGSTTVAGGQYAHTGGSFGAALAPVGSNGFLTQGLSLSASTTYTLSYFLAVFGAGGDPPPVLNNFSVSIDGLTLNSLTLVNANASPYTKYTANFTTLNPTGGSLQFTFRNDPGSFGLDDVDVSLASASVATPLPPTLLAGFVGMAVLAGVRRLRRA